MRSFHSTGLIVTLDIQLRNIGVQSRSSDRVNSIARPFGACVSFLSRFFGRRGHLTDDRARGRKGEELALHELAKKGYRVLERNWRCRMGEIDLICMDNGTLVIVEVKLRANDFFGNPEEFVTKSKQKKLIKAADFYIKENNIFWETRFDIIAIIENPNELKVEHFEGAFYPTL